MATKDMMTTLNLINDFWPDFTITKENLVSPTADFMVRFFTYFLKEYNESFAGLANEESLVEVQDPKTALAQEFGSAVVLYRRMGKTLRKMNYTNLTLMDIYSPQPKRVHAVVKYCIHFLIYVNNNMETITNNCNSLFDKQSQLEELSALKQQYLQEIAQNAEKLTRIQTNRERLRKRLEEKKTRFEELPLEKARKEKIFFDKSLQKTGLESEVNNLDYQLQGLEQKEKTLQEHVVSKEDFDSLRNSEKYLEMELEQIDREICSVNNEVNVQVDALQDAEQHLTGLEEIDFDAVSTELEVLSDLEKKEKSLLLENKELRKELKATSALKSKILQQIDKKTRIEEEGRELLSSFQVQFASDVEAANRLYEKKVAHRGAVFQEAERLETEIEETKTDITNIDNEAKTLKLEAILQYKKVLDASKASTCKMNKTLLVLKK